MKVRDQLTERMERILAVAEGDSPFDGGFNSHVFLLFLLASPALRVHFLHRCAWRFGDS